MVLSNRDDSHSFKMKICCGIVLYNPNVEQLKRNIDILIVQVGKIILIDNNSDNQEAIATMLDGYHGDIFYLKNKENIGIATALNQLLRYALENGFAWYLSMDQDSLCATNLIETYMRHIPQQKRVAVYCPFVLNNQKITFDEYCNTDRSQIMDIVDPVQCITSGSLTNVLMAQSVGGYDDQLFIDCVDIEFNIRLLAAGYRIVRVNQTYMFQEMGVGKKVPFFAYLYEKTKKNFFKALRVTPVYSDVRLYYIVRNSIFVRRKYGKKAGHRMSSAWMVGQFLYYFFTYPFRRNRIDMVRAIFKGIKDSNSMERFYDIGRNDNL